MNMGLNTKELFFMFFICLAATQARAQQTQRQSQPPSQPQQAAQPTPPANQAPRPGYSNARGGLTLGADAAHNYINGETAVAGTIGFRGRVESMRPIAGSALHVYSAASSTIQGGYGATATGQGAPALNMNAEGHVGLYVGGSCGVGGGALLIPIRANVSGDHSRWSAGTASLAAGSVQVGVYGGEFGIFCADNDQAFRLVGFVGASAIPSSESVHGASVSWSVGQRARIAAEIMRQVNPDGRPTRATASVHVDVPLSRNLDGYAEVRIVPEDAEATAHGRTDRLAELQGSAGIVFTQPRETTQRLDPPANEGEGAR